MEKIGKLYKTLITMTIFKKKINKKKFPLVTVDCVLF